LLVYVIRDFIFVRLCDNLYDIGMSLKELSCIVPAFSALTEFAAIGQKCHSSCFLEICLQSRHNTSC